MVVPEVLAPAGNFETAMTAFRYGADAIYCGLPIFSLRTRENAFSEADIEKVVDFARKNGKKVYVTINIFPHEALLPRVERHLKFLAKVMPDGVIFSDFGVLAMLKKFAPEVPRHLSVQTSTVNSEAVKMWQNLGVERIILAREMSIAEVAKLKRLAPEMEFEIFVHGSVCMAYSGRCLLSNFSSGRGANFGNCNHACRWNFEVKNYHVPEIEAVREHEKSCRLSSPKFPGGIGVEENVHGTHFMNSRDLCLIEHVAEIVEAGVCSLKIEGRNKTAYYCATIVRAYRQAVDNWVAGRDFDRKLWDEVRATANRGFFTGFLHGKPLPGDVQYSENRTVGEKKFVGIVKKWESGRIEIEVKNQIATGDRIEVLMPKMEDDFVFEASEMKFGDVAVEVFHGGNDREVASLRCEREVETGVFLRVKT